MVFYYVMASIVFIHKYFTQLKVHSRQTERLHCTRTIPLHLSTVCVSILSCTCRVVVFIIVAVYDVGIPRSWRWIKSSRSEYIGHDEMEMAIVFGGGALTSYYY